MVFELGSALDACIAHIADLRRVEFVPFCEMELEVEISNEFGVDKVDKSIADIAVSLRDWIFDSIVNW